MADERLPGAIRKRGLWHTWCRDVLFSIAGKNRGRAERTTWPLLRTWEKWTIRGSDATEQTLKGGYASAVEFDPMLAFDVIHPSVESDDLLGNGLRNRN